MHKLEVISRQAEGNKKAAPLLFVHGAWHGAWCWDKYFLPYFSANGYDAHALSLRNHGKSDSPGSLKTVRIRDYVDDVARIAATFNSPPVIIGHSMGGFVLQKYLEDHEAAGAVLLASTPPTGVVSAALNMLVSDPQNFLKANCMMSLYPLVSKPAQARKLFFHKDMPSEEVLEYHAQLGDESFFAFMGMLFTLPTPMRIKLTPLVLGGGLDTVFPPKVIRATAEAYGTMGIVVENTAHDMMLDPNWKVVADNILSWLQAKING